MKREGPGLNRVHVAFEDIPAMQTKQNAAWKIPVTADRVVSPHNAIVTL